MARSYSDETKAAALAALLEGQAVTHVAKEYNIPRSTVSTWKRRELGDIGATVATQKKEEIGDLIAEYLRATLQALRVQAQHAANEDWLRKQNAADFAVMHGVQTDKAIRLLEALGRDSSD